MQIVYAGEKTPEKITSTIFLVGPTPRDSTVPSWRPEMIVRLIDEGYTGTVFVPEPRDGLYMAEYEDQIEWEKKHLEMADLILAWVPRNDTNMPAFTTNVEFGMYLKSGKLLYGRPEGSYKTTYLDYMYKGTVLETPCSTIREMAKRAVDRIKDGRLREHGERFVPLHIYETPMFQSWLAAQKRVGNRLDDARVLWEFNIGINKFLLSYVMWVKVWIAAESRYKENEFIFSRRDISCVVPFYPNYESILDTEIVLIKEFRSPAHNEECFVYELPGGSSFKPDKDPFQVAASELKEETGLDIPYERFTKESTRQLSATLSTHRSHVFTVKLSPAEILEAIETENKGTSFGVSADTERTYVVVRKLRQIIDEDLVDYSTIGMIFEAIHSDPH